MEKRQFGDTARFEPDFKMEIDLTAADFLTEWKRCNMVANYLADYSAYEYKNREQAENLFSTIINELLEAIARLAETTSVIHFKLQPEDEQLSILVDHECQAPLVPHYADFVQNIGQDSGNALYLELLVNDDLPAPAFNQLGLAMIVHDFGGRINLEQRGDTPFLCTRVSIPTNSRRPTIP